MREIDKLTTLEVKNAVPKEKPYKLMDGGGLYLLILANGGKYWHYRYRFNGKEKLLAIGVYPEVSVKDARKARDDGRKLLANGDDPSGVKQRLKRQNYATNENSFEAIALEWWEVRRETLNPDHALRVLGYLQKDIFPELGSRPIAKIETPDIYNTLRKVEKRGALDVAARELQNVNSIFSFAIQRGLINFNPAQALKGALKKRPTKNRPALRMADLPVFLHRLRENSTSNLVTKLAVKFCVLTFCRPETIRFARWCDIDLDKKLWVVPVQFMKVKADRGGADHIVPLTKQLLELLDELRPITGHGIWLFPGERVRKEPMSDGTMNQCINRLGYKGLATPSGFRTTACSFLNEQGFNRDAIERQMAHMERNAVRAAYLHHAEFLDERKRLMDFWSNHIDKLEAETNVVAVDFATGVRG